jgi:SAM-dependent methyltransferase
MRIREPWPRARTRQRRREFAAVFGGIAAHALGDGLEIGAGDGFLASMLLPHCRSLVTTDSYRARLADATAAAGQRLVCDAVALPFAAASFDFIFSSSVLEHVRDRPAAFAEMDRCLRPGGVMLHIMPSRTWKLLQLVFYYPHLILGGLDLGLERLSRERSRERSSERSPHLALSEPPVAAGERWSDRRNWRLSLRTIAQGAIPRVHGEFPGHVSEWRGFGARAWTDEFAAAGFRTRRILLLPLYSGYGFGLERLRSLGERLRLSSHNAFVVTRDDDVVAALALAGFERAPAPALPMRSALPASPAI